MGDNAMNDFIRGFLSVIATWIIGIVVLILFIVGIATNNAWLSILVIILGGATIFGIRYWLGHIVRIR